MRHGLLLYNDPLTSPVRLRWYFAPSDESLRGQAAVAFAIAACTSCSNARALRSTIIRCAIATLGNV